MGDFVKGPIDDLFNPQIANGVLFHRRVDAFADNHAMSRASRNLFSPRCRRYAGVILDICYDHFLSKNWSVYTDSDLSEFITRVYETLQRYHDILPVRLQSVLPRMVQQNWLNCYRTLGGVDITLGRIAQRIHRENTLDDSIGEIRKNYGQLERNFHAFFPDLIDFARSFPV
jgi:acyl carrier protein phosphodiesterase